MLFQLRLQSKTGTLRPLPIKKRRPDLKITLKKLANEPLGARFQALFANWDALLPIFFNLFYMTVCVMMIQGDSVRISLHD